MFVFSDNRTAEQRLIDRIREELERATESFEDTWPDDYINSERGKQYAPHHQAEHDFVYQDGPWRYGLAKGGEGGGKSVAGVIKDLERLRRGMSGIMVSPDLPHFKRSLWPEFRRWCPWDQVVQRQQYRQAFEWEPSQPFTLAFKNGTVLYCGGIDDPISWEGPNVSFAHLDEGRRKKDAGALKVLDGRVRIPGPAGEMPQIFITTTPKKHWLYECFGPVAFECDECRHQFEIEPGDTLLKVTCPECNSESVGTNDVMVDFKVKSKVITLLTKDNEANLSPGYTEDRALSLTESEIRVHLMAEWEDLEDSERFLPSISLWDACEERLPALLNTEPLVVALDAAVSGDHFALVALSPHPDSSRRNTVAIRWAESWVPPRGGKINYQGTDDAPGPEKRLRWLCKNYNVVQACYDPYQLHDMATRLSVEGVGWFEVFSQQNKRNESDMQLLQLILEKRIAHEGQRNVRDHVDNADRKVDDDDHKIRMVKRERLLKIDLAVATSMGSHRLLELMQQMGIFAW